MTPSAYGTTYSGFRACIVRVNKGEFILRNKVNTSIFLNLDVARNSVGASGLCKSVAI